MSVVFDAWVARRARRAYRAAFALLALLAVVESASADAKKSRADTLFDEGKTLLQNGDWPGACAKFQASFDADPAVSTQVKIARCREHEGKLVQALGEYRRARELNQKLSQSPGRKKELEELIASDLRALEPRISKLSFRITPVPEGLEVRVNGTLVPRSALGTPVEVDPGQPEVLVRAPGYREERLKPKVPEAVTYELVLALVPEAPATAPVAVAAVAAAAAAPPPSATPPASAPPAQAPPKATDTTETATGAGQRTFGLVVGGAGIVALGVAGYFGVKTLVLVNAASPHCPNSVCDDEGFRMVHDATEAQTIGLVTGGIGAVLVGTGLTIYLTAPADEPTASAALLLSPSGATLRGSF